MFACILLPADITLAFSSALHMQDPLAASLLACAIMRALANEDFENQYDKERRENAKKMEHIACRLLEEYNSNSNTEDSKFPEGEAHDALLHVVHALGRRTCLDLARSAGSIQFAKQAAFQTLTEKIWYGGIEGPTRKLLYIFFCIPIITLLIFIWPLEIIDLEDYLDDLVSDACLDACIAIQYI